MNRRDAHIIDANVVGGVPTDANWLPARNRQGLGWLRSIMDLEIEHRRAFVHRQ
jgi:hypothetical protein